MKMFGFWLTFVTRLPVVIAEWFWYRGGPDLFDTIRSVYHETRGT